MASRKEYEMLFQLDAKLGSSYTSTFSKAKSGPSELQKEIRSLQSVQADISAYTKQQAAVEKTQAKLDNLNKQYQLLQQEIKETNGPTTSLERESAKLEQRIGDTSNALAAQKEKLGATAKSLNEAGVGTDNLGSKSQDLADKLNTLRAKEEAAAESAEEYGDKGTSSIEAVSQAFAAAKVYEALEQIKDAYMDCINSAGDFEASMSNVEALSGASGDQLQALTDKAKEMGATTKFTAGESADALSYMALAGWDTQSMLQGISPVMELAAAANMDLASASDIVTDYLTAFGLTASDTTHFVDVMAYAMSHSNTNVEQLGEAYKACAATAKSMGYSVEETTAVLATMANAGVKGGEAGTALNTIMTRLATNTKGCADELEKYGVSIYDSQGNMNSLSDILTGLSAVWDNLTDQEQANLAKTIAGTNQYSKLQTIMAGCSEQAAKGGQSFTKFFFRIPTEVQLRELGRPLDDADMMWFFERAIRCDGRPLGLPLHCTDVTTAERIAGRGMQVGSLVSQMTANVVMTPADHYIKRELCAPYYARYMDDMGAIIEGKAAAWELVEEVDNYLQTNLGLNLNQKTAVIPIGSPVEFVGRKISPVKIELRRQTTLGMKKHLRYVQDAYAAGEIDLDYALSVITSYRGLFKDVTSDAFLEKMLDEFVLSRPALEA